MPRSSLTIRTPGFARLAVRWILGLAGLYALYAWSTFIIVDGESAVAESILMALGPAMTALSLVVSPALFAAALDHFDLFGEQTTSAGRRHWIQLMLFSVLASGLSALGPTVATMLAPTVLDQPPESLAAPPPESVRLLFPFVVAVFTAASAVVGSWVGHVTRLWRPKKREAVRRLACLALVASFWVPLLVAANLIVNHDFPAASLLAPLVLPLSTISISLWLEGRRLGTGVTSWFSRRQSTSLDGKVLNQIVSAVAGPRHRGLLDVDALAQTEAEVEMAHLASGIRQIAARKANLSESRVQEIVAALVSVPQATPAKSSLTERLGNSIEFWSSWACLAAGFLLVSPLVGVPPILGCAVAVAFPGSIGIVLAIRYCATLPPTVPT